MPGQETGLARSRPIEASWRSSTARAEPVAARANRPDELLGRKREHETLRDSMDAVTRTGRVVVVTGATWMGKTRLLEDLAAEAGSRGSHVMFGRAYRMEQGLPYGVVTQMLRNALPLIKSVIAEIPGWALTEMTRLIPELGPAPLAASDRFGELRLYEGVHAVLKALTESRRLVLLIDDIQWIDPASAGLIAYIARRISETPILLTMASRVGEPMLDPVADLVRAADVVLAVEPLNAEDLLIPCNSPASTTSWVSLPRTHRRLSTI
ncbi:MAG TPA: ATP-binding protein [Acidimicrobiia bacterium]|nr:ATP-binding protein [Acidimicrobiia bacterium]